MRQHVSNMASLTARASLTACWTSIIIGSHSRDLKTPCAMQENWHSFYKIQTFAMPNVNQIAQLKYSLNSSKSGIRTSDAIEHHKFSCPSGKWEKWFVQTTPNANLLTKLNSSKAGKQLSTKEWSLLLAIKGPETTIKCTVYGKVAIFNEGLGHAKLKVRAERKFNNVGQHRFPTPSTTYMLNIT